MSVAENLEQPVAALEAEVAQLRVSISRTGAREKAGWEAIYGTFANDPIYDEAMRLGREYRESLRPKPARSRKS